MVNQFSKLKIKNGCILERRRFPIKELRIPVHVKRSHSLRLKIIDSCGMTCVFCHNEGTPVASDNLGREVNGWTRAGRSGRKSIYLATNGAKFLPATIFPDKEFAHALKLLCDALEVKEVHLTGGEPTLHPQLAQIIRMIHEMGFQVCMTSNGKNGKKVLPACVEAGLSRVNFSIFGTLPEELAQIQHEKFQNPQLASSKIAALKKSLEIAASRGIKVSANIVVPNHSHVFRVRRLLEEYSPKITVRLLNSLDDGQSSVNAIYGILTDLRAVPVARYITAGVSGFRTAYRLPSGRLVYFKQIRPVHLPKTCKGCRFNNEKNCQEGYYGVRLYRDLEGGYQVGVCIQRMDLCMRVEEFVHSDLCEEIISLREAEYASCFHGQQ